MAWTKVLAQDALPVGARQVVKIGDKNILVLNHEGTIYAVENACPHLKLPMKKGKITESGAIVCPWHRSSFNLCTGKAQDWITFPPVVSKVMGMVASEKDLGVFPTRIEDNAIQIDIGA